MPLKTKAAPTPSAATASPEPPQQAYDFIPSSWTGWVGVLGFTAGVVWLNKIGPGLQLNRYWEALVLMAFTSVPMMIFDTLLFVRRANGQPIEGLTKIHAYSAGRTVIKLIGLLGSLFLLLFCYWVFPEYYPSLKPDGGFYSNFFTACQLGGHWALLVCVVYFFWVDPRMKQPEDGYWHFGNAVLLNFRVVDWAKVRNHLRTWAVKGFFLPLMFKFLCDNLPGLHWWGQHTDALNQLFSSGDFRNPQNAFLTIHRWAHCFLFSIDLAFVSCGYILTLRMVQSHVRSAEPTALGWTVTLMCYPPFWRMFNELYLDYVSPSNWEGKLGGTTTFYLVGIGIFVFEAIFVWATIAFGLRFSNLTHRGIVRTGPYYFTKHPAYITKICAFFLTFLPWIDSRGLEHGVRNLFMLAGLCLIYRWRAKTEERHLASIDPTYGLYAEEIRQRHRRWLRLDFRPAPKT